MAMNCPQLVKPRACRSALCSLTAFSNSPREKSFNTCEKMLHTFIRLSLLRLNWFLSGTQSSVSGTQPLAGSDTLGVGQQLAREFGQQCRNTKKRWIGGTHREPPCLLYTSDAADE